jgi:DNA-binding MarR family transcriptional regulator
VSQEGLPRRRIRFGDRRGLEAWNTLLTFFNLVRTAVAAMLGPVKLSNDELLVLICLSHTDGALSMGAIERSTFLQAGRLRRVVDKLETRRLLAWRRSRADRRKVLVRVKKPGLELVESLAPAMFEVVHRVAEALGEDGTEFMRAKMRKIVSSAAVGAEGSFGDPCRDDIAQSAPPQPTSESGAHSTQRPSTWGLAGWLRWCQWSGQVDRIWRMRFRNLGLTQRRLQILAALSGATEGLTVDAITSATGLPPAAIASTLPELERAGLVSRWGDRSPPGNRPATLTPKGAYKVLEALPMANNLAEDLYQGLSDEDLEQVLSLVRKACGAAWQVKSHYDAAQPVTSATSAQ